MVNIMDIYDLTLPLKPITINIKDIFYPTITLKLISDIQNIYIKDI